MGSGAKLPDTEVFRMICPKIPIEIDIIRLTVAITMALILCLF